MLHAVYYMHNTGEYQGPKVYAYQDVDAAGTQIL